MSLRQAEALSSAMKSSSLAENRCNTASAADGGPLMKKTPPRKRGSGMLGASGEGLRRRDNPLADLQHPSPVFVPVAYSFRVIWTNTILPI